MGGLLNATFGNAVELIIGIVAGLLGMDDNNPNVRTIIDFHKSIGLTLLGLVAAQGAKPKS